MSFVRINPTNWAFGASYTSAQANAQDVYWPSAMDKTGDTASGQIIFASGASILLRSGSNIETQSGCTFRVDSGTIAPIALANAGSFISLSNSAAFHAYSDASAFYFENTVNLSGTQNFTGTTNFTGSSTNLNFSNHAQVYCTDGTCTFQIQLGPGGQAIGSTAIQYPNASNYQIGNAAGNGQTRTIFQPFNFATALANNGGGSGFTNSSYAAGFPAGGGNSATSIITLPIDMMHDKAVLSGASVVMAVSPSNPNSGPPSSLPVIDIRRYTVDGSGAHSGFYGTQSLIGGVQTLDVDYVTGGDNQQTCNLTGFTSPYTTINRAAYRYFLVLEDDNSSYAGNIYFGLLLTFSSINSLTFP